MVGIVVGAGLVVLGTVVLVCHRHDRRRAALGCAMRRLKATAEQKQRLSALFEDVHSRLALSKERARALHRDLFALWAAPTLDAKGLEALEAQMFELVGEGSHAVREALTRAHEILEPKQRQQVVDWVRWADRHHHHFSSVGCHRWSS